MKDRVNSQVVEFIAAISGSRETQAVLVDGKWGSGKTFIVKDTLKPSDPLYVSVNGVKTSEELRRRLLAEAYPLLSNGTMKALGSVAKSVAGMFRFQTDLKLEDLKDVPPDRILIFDDLERKAMGVAELLGFINEFVEHGGHKVVLIANEDEIKDKSYRAIKEKIIGYTLRVEPDFMAAFPGFVSEFPHSYRDFLDRNQEAVFGVLSELEVSNLRILKHALSSFEPIFEKCNERLSDEQIDSLFVLFVTIVVLAKTAKIDRATLLTRPTEATTVGMHLHAKKGESPFVDAHGKLKTADVFSPEMSNEFLAARIFDGVISDVELERSISDLLAKKDVTLNPSWRVLWYYMDLEESDFQAVKSKFLQDFSSRKFKDAGEIVHSFGVHLELSHAGLLGFSASESYKECERYIDDVRHEVAGSGANIKDEFGHGGALGLGFMQSGPKLRRLIDKLSVDVDAAYQRSLEIELSTAMSSFPNQLDELREVLLGNELSNKLFKRPGLHTLDAVATAQLVATSPAAAQRSFLTFIDKRLADDFSKVIFAAEKKWLSAFRAELLRQAKAAGSLTQRRLSLLINRVLPKALFARSKKAEAQQ